MRQNGVQIMLRRKMSRNYVQGHLSGSRLGDCGDCRSCLVKELHFCTEKKIYPKICGFSTDFLYLIIRANGLLIYV